MFCPQCGHQQVADDTQFCSRCGLSLGITDLLLVTPSKLQREKRELTGVAIMLATVLMLLNFLLVFGVTTLPHLNPVFLWIWLFFMVNSLVVGGFGLANLIRSGFFKRFKEREMLLRLQKMQHDRQVSTTETERLGVASGAKHLAEVASITEMTTRELDLIPRTEKRDIR